jgi:hypothetical protein
MLMRHITAQLAGDMGLIVSRVDFDHLSADFPVRRPGQLLLDLADELEPFIATGRHEALFSRFRSQVVELHEQLSAEPPPGDPLRNARSEAFNTILRTFCGVLQLMPESKRVVLILDTCEELAKLQPVGMMMPSVEATFLILEQMHSHMLETERPLKVVFAGRRLLAQSGYGGWHITPDAKRHGAPLLPGEKTYLALQEIRGFDESEARRFFTDIRQIRPSDAVMTAILRHSPDPGTAASVDWTPKRPANTQSRFNPFDLALYADWLSELPSLEASTIDSGEIDSYVDIRIVQRIRAQDVLTLMPAVVLLGRFDRDMLRAGFRESDIRFEEAFRELGGMEWIDHQGDFLEVERNLRPRMLEYYERQRGHELEIMRQRLASGLRAQVDGRRPAQLEVEHVDSALRLLDGRDAADTWQHLAEKIAHDGAWDWAQKVVTRLLGEDGAVYAVQHPARAGVRAIHIAAVLHESAADTSAYWREVSETATNEPDARRGEWLRRRARLGAIANSRGAPPRPERDWLNAQLDELAEPSADMNPEELAQLDGAVCAALETLLEIAEQSVTRSVFVDMARIEAWASRVERSGAPNQIAARGLAAFARCLAARAQSLIGNSMAAAGALSRALDLVGDARDLDRHLQSFCDWRAPARILDRVRLEALRLSRPGAEPFTALQEATWWAETLVDLHSIDAERLASALLDRRLAFQVPEPDVLTAAERADGFGPEWDRQPRCNAHRAVPPLFSTTARGWLGTGDVARALDGLDLRTTAASGTAQDDAIVRATRLARVQVIRRMRLVGRETALVDALSRSARTADEAASAWAARVLTTSNPSFVAQIPLTSAAMIHAWWRSQAASTTASAEAATAALSKLLTTCRPPGPGFDDLSLRLDLLEAGRLGVAFEAPEPWSSADAAFVGDGIQLLADQQGQTDNAYRLRLRAYALLDGSHWLEELDVERAPRRLAELALDEAELLSLRLPAQAGPLLEHAARWFSATNDRAGIAIARLARSIAANHAGLPQDSAAALPSSYAALAEAVPGTLPPLDEVMASLESGESVLPELSGGAEWQGWFDRLIVHLVDAQRRPTATTLMAMRYESPLPIELDTRPFDTPGLREPAVHAASQVAAPASRAGVSISWSDVGYISLGLLFVAALAAIVYAGISFSVDSIAQGVSGNSVEVGVIFVLVLGIPTTSSSVRRAARAWLATRGDLMLTIAPVADATDVQSSVILLERRARPAVAVPPYSLRGREQTVGQVRMRGLQDYRRAAKELPDQIMQRLATLHSTCVQAPFTWTIQLPLVVDASLTGYPWEALVALAIPGDDSQRAVEVFDYWRMGRSLGVSRQSDPEPSALAVRLLADANWTSLARLGWSALGGAEEATPAELTGKSRASAGIIHVIGTPVKASAGWQIRLGGGGGGGTTGTSSSVTDVRESPIQTRETAIRGEAPLVPADALAVGPDTIVVMQAQPADALERLAAERELATDWRSTSGEVFAAGAGAVLMLPSLPSEVCVAVLDDLARALERQRGSRVSTLLRATRTIRKRIARLPGQATEASSGSSSGQVELALEVTLFARAENAGETSSV